MQKKILDDILTLLAVSIIADKQIYACEVEAFIEIATTIEAELGYPSTLSQTKLMAWFYRNNGRLKSMMSMPDFGEQLNGILDRLSALPNKAPILSRMHYIACSDQDLHVSEKALLTLAARHWQVSARTLGNMLA